MPVHASVAATALAYLFACAFGLAFIVAASGWGVLICRLAGRADCDFAHRTAIGIAGATITGGVLEVTRAISPAAVLGLLVLGAVAAAFPPGRGSRLTSDTIAGARTWAGRPTPLVAALAAVVTAFALLQYAGSVSTGRSDDAEVTAGNFNNHDDFHAYMVFPHKMLETGSQGADPFSERRLASALGGKSFLDAFVLATLSDRNLHLMDPGVGLLVLGLGFLVWARRAAVPREVALAALLLLVAIPPPTVNITAVAITGALFLALAREGPLADWTVGESRDRSSARAALLPVVLVAGLATLKTTAIIPAALLGIVVLAMRPATLRARVMRVTVGGLAAVLLISPWMMSLYRSSGTLLFPLLGRGFRGPAPDPTGLPLNVLDLLGTDSMSRRGLFVFAIVVGGWWLATGTRRRTGDVLLAGCAIATVGLMALGLRGVDVYRHAYAVIMPTMLVMIARVGTVAVAERAGPGSTRRGSTMLGVAATGIGVVALGVLFARDALTRHRAAATAIAFGARGGVLDTPESRDSLRAIQATVPAGAPILTRLTRPYLLDFARNPIFINDWPGGASPPPGLPAFQGPDAMASYLTSVGVRYFAYSYRDEAGYPAATLSARLEPPTPPWIRNQTRYAIDFQETAAALGALRRRIADDGEAFVVDLCVSADGAIVSTAAACAVPTTPRPASRRF